MRARPTRIISVTATPISIRKAPATPGSTDPDALPVTFAALKYPSGGATIQLLSSNPTPVGYYILAAKPAVNDTLSFNGVVFTFKAASGGATEITIGATLATAIANAVAMLNASADPLITPATYSSSAAGRIDTTYDTPGSVGNGYTLDTATGGNVTRSSATLIGGGAYGTGQDVPAGEEYKDFSQGLDRYAVASGAGPTLLSVTDYEA